MTTQENTYKIEAGAIVTEYEGATEEEALDNYAKDAGYSDYADLVDQHGEVDSVSKVPSPEEIARFLVDHNIAIQPNQSYYVWESEDSLHLTVNSWEYRDSDHELITTIRFMDEVPGDEDVFIECVEFQMSQKA